VAEILVKAVFPQLREWASKRKIHIVDIDLRYDALAAIYLMLHCDFESLCICVDGAYRQSPRQRPY
jgi:hypothetical protein